MGVRARFRWFVASPDSGGELQPVAGLDSDGLTVDPLLYLPGDVLRVRVEITDRTAAWPLCPASADSCGPASCRQRLTWTLEVR